MELSLGVCHFRLEYDESGNLAKETYTDLNGNGTIKEYDGSGNLVKETHTNPDGRRFVYEYDEKGNVLKLTTEHYNEDGELLFSRCEEYDEKENVIKLTHINADGSGYVCEYEYDEDGNLVNETMTEIEAPLS